MKYALGFLITGVIYLLLGGGVIVLNKKRLAGRGIVPERSMAELQKDKQWLKKSCRERLLRAAGRERRTKARLQRRTNAARDSISHTVEEIKETVGEQTRR
jgi:hypothetical protein